MAATTTMAHGAAGEARTAATPGSDAQGQPAPPIPTETLAARWQTATVRLERRRDDHGYHYLSETNSRAVDRFYRALEDLAATLTEGADAGELGDLAEVTGDLLNGPVRAALFAWAEDSPARRHAAWLEMRRDLAAKIAAERPELTAALAAEIDADAAAAVARRA